MIIGLLVAAAVAIACRIAYCHGFKAGVDFYREAQRNQKLGAVCERWAGHVSHRGHRIVSPIRQDESEVEETEEELRGKGEGGFTPRKRVSKIGPADFTADRDASSGTGGGT